MISRSGLVIVVLASGCSSLLDLAPGTPVDPAPAGCATGWSYRVPIEIENRSGTTLSDYQIAIPLDVAAAITTGKLADGAADLRFGLDEDTQPLAYTIDGDLANGAARAWVAMPEVPVGTTRIYAYYGNPEAPHWNGASPFIDNLLFNPSFETTGSWTLDTTSRTFEMSTAWASDGQISLAVDAYRAAKSNQHLDLGVSQLATFPPGSDYVLLFDLRVLAASNGGIAGESNGIFFVSAGNGLEWLWSLDGTTGNITGEYRNMETAPFGPGNVGISLGVSLRPGSTPAYAKGFFDNVRIRKHVAPEPEVHVGVEQDACAS